jgi:hypothetical protein
MRRWILVGLAFTAVAFEAATVDPFKRSTTVLAAAGSEATAEKSEDQRSPEEKMARRFPQKIRVGDLIGLPVLDWSDRTIGYVQQVVRTPVGKIQLIVPYRPWFGWVSYGGVFAWGKRPVAVPLETVAMLGRQVAALDMSREEFDAAPTFESSQATPIGPNETIRIALTRR